VKNLDPRRARWIRLRIGVLSGVMALGLGGFVSTAYRVQVDDGAAWRETAEKQRQRRLHIEPKRGTIYDRNGTALAVSVEVPSVSADVVEMLHGADTPEAQTTVLRDAAARLSRALSLDAGELYAKLEQRKRFVWIKRRISGDETASIREMSDPKKQLVPVRGLTIEGEGHRYYPGRELAGPVLGFVAPDGQGKDGLELALDEDLRGHVEEVKGLRDRSGRLIFAEGSNDDQALEGHDVTLSLDEGIQHIAEQELDAAQRTYETKGASIVVVDPNTGELYALASSPGYNPNDYGDSEVDARRDRVVVDRFEPGSAMKPFTLAAALAAGTTKPTESIYCEHGTYEVGNVVIHDTHVNDWLTPTQILARSSNIGALKIGLGLGEPSLYAAFRRFGFGEPSGLPLPGEAAGVLRPRNRPWFEVETANASFGQGISVTTVQLAMGYAAIANGGRLLEPVLVRKVTDARGNIVREGAPHVRREVLQPQLARMLTEMLTAVTETGGTATEAAIPGLRVAGKTGTAQKVDPATGKYSMEHFTASFIGIVPAERPRLVVAVVLDEPTIGHYGGDLAGPVFRRVAEASLRYLGVSAGVSSKTPPGSSDPRASGSPGGAVSDSLADTKTAFATQVSVMTLGQGEVRVPDAAGLGARDALRLFTSAGLMPEIEGSGRLVRQAPAAGAATPKGGVVHLVFEPPS
jgi:cell division protein FtsI (penicillin-binding protein 3)